MTWSAPIERTMSRFLRAAHAGDFSPKRFGNLHGKRPHAPGRTVNQNLLPWLKLSFVAQALQSGERRHGNGRCLPRTIGWPVSVLISFHPHTHTRQTPPSVSSKHLIPWQKLCDVFANRFNPPRDVGAEPRVFGFEKALRQAGQEWLASHAMPVQGICGCRMNFHQHLVILGSRFFYLCELKHVR